MFSLINIIITNNNLVMSAKHGSSLGHNFRLVSVNYKSFFSVYLSLWYSYIKTQVKLNHNEYVTGLSWLTSWRGINSLTFYTNRGKHGPICSVSSAPVCSNPAMQEIDLMLCDRREFGGFFGSDDTHHLKSIRIYVSPIPRSFVKRENVWPSKPHNLLYGLLFERNTFFTSLIFYVWFVIDD